MGNRTLVKALQESAELYGKLVADGTPRDEASRIVGEGLAHEWGKRKDATYRCFLCRDTGWILKKRSASKLYGPEWGDETVAHKCGEGCGFLAWERSQRPTNGEASVAAAGQVRRRA